MRRIEPQPGWIGGRYLVVAASDTAFLEWNAFAIRCPRAAQRAYERLSTAPLERQSRRQFPLRGAVLKPFWEFEASGADRIWYAVDVAGLTVIVAARDDVHASPRLTQLLKNRRVAYESAVAEVMKVAIKETTDGPLRVPAWVFKKP